MTCTQRGSTALPLGIMMGDVPQPRFGVMAENFPGEIKRFAICFGKHCRIDFSDSAEMVPIVFAQITPSIAARTAVEPRALFSNVLRFRSYRAVFHRKISAIAYRAPVFSQVITVGEKEELQRF